MKLRTSLAMLLALTATMASAVDLYSVFELPDHGKGSRGRHIQSWGPGLGVAVGDVTGDDAVRHAAIWPMITMSGPGQLVELVTEDPYAFSTAASSARLTNGRNLVVGQRTDALGRMVATAWINSAVMEYEYISLNLTAGAGSTGSEALNVAPLPNGGAVISGTDWFVGPNGQPTWLAVIWLVSPSGQVTERTLPVPPGTGWAIPQSRAETQTLLAGAFRLVGRIQQTPGGPWRACMWQVNQLTGFAQFAYIDRNGPQTYGSEVSSLGDADGTPATDLSDLAVGWTEVNGQDFGTFWVFSQGYPARVLSMPSRLYGANSRGYMSGWFMRQGTLEGLVSHVSLLGGQSPFAFSDLIISLDTWEHGFHLFSLSEHGFNTGCGTSSDYPGGPDKMHAHAGVPTGMHGADRIAVRRGKPLSTDGQINSWIHDGNDDEVEAHQGRVVLDFSFYSLPEVNDTVLLSAIWGDSSTCGVDIAVFNWETGQFDAAGPTFQVSPGNLSHTLSWATFPSSYMSRSGEIKLRVSMKTPGRRDVVHLDKLTLATN